MKHKPNITDPEERYGDGTSADDDAPLDFFETGHKGGNNDNPNNTVTKKQRSGINEWLKHSLLYSYIWIKNNMAKGQILPIPLFFSFDYLSNRFSQHLVPNKL